MNIYTHTSVFNNILSKKGRETFKISLAEFHLNNFHYITRIENILSIEKCFLDVINTYVNMHLQKLKIYNICCTCKVAIFFEQTKTYY